MKKTLSILLSIVLALTSLGAGTAVFAKEQPKTASVEFSVYDGEFIKEPTLIEVSADLSDKYGYTDEGSEPTILDATIAAHLNMFKSTEFFLVNNGWTVSAFNKSTENFSYRVSGNFANGLNDAVKDGDYVEYMFYQDKISWSDAYTFFEARQKNAFAFEKVTFTLKKEGFDESWNPVIAPVENAAVLVNGFESGTTDENGEITLSFDMPGTYNVTTANNVDGAPIFAPWCVVEVTNTKLFTYVEDEIRGAAEFVLSSEPAMDVTNAVDYLTYLKSGYNISEYNEGFTKSVKDNLDENGGKLKINGYENIAAYGAVIQILDFLGYNTKNFEGYNLVSAFESIETNSIPPAFNPYLFRVAIDAASEEYAKALCDKLIEDHYVDGKGLYHGAFACDNNAMFITMISRFKDDPYYANYIKDAKTLIEECTTDKGAFFSKEYTDVNADSTAYAMMAFASIGETETAFKYYKMLVAGFEGKTGVFASAFSELYATKNALLGLEYFRDCILPAGFEHPEEIIKTTVKKATTKQNGYISKTCCVCGKTTKTTIYYPKKIDLAKTAFTYTGDVIHPRFTVTNSNGKTISSKNYSVKYSKNKTVGTASMTITFKGNYSGSVTKTFKINPKGTTLSKLTAQKKGFTAKWNKQSTQTTGYQIKYSSAKSFKNYTIKTVSSPKTTKKTITNLKAGKKYYVRIRTYKTVNGKKYYSAWSKSKSVTTKK